MKINFILPPNGNHPVGGFKIVFQYANQLARLGHDVHLSFLNDLYPEKKTKLRVFLSFVKKKLFRIGRESEITWFNLDKRISLHFNVMFERELPKADIIIATAAQTAVWIKGISDTYGDKFYFIQGYETWAYPEARLVETFKNSIAKIVVAKWLYDIVIKYSKKVYVIPNFLDDSVYYKHQDLNNRGNTISMLFHEEPQKNTEFGLAVLAIVKKKIPDLEVKLFGVFDEPKDLPDYVAYYKSPSQVKLRDEIYGTSKVYLLPSLSEGWGLTGMEAMKSGAVLISSRINGILEYACSEKNAVLINPNDLVAFVNETVSILQNEDLRLRLATTAINDISRYSVSNSTDTLLKVLSKNGKRY